MTLTPILPALSITTVFALFLIGEHSIENIAQHDKTYKIGHNTEHNNSPPPNTKKITPREKR